MYQGNFGGGGGDYFYSHNGINNYDGSNNHQYESYNDNNEGVYYQEGNPDHYRSEWNDNGGYEAGGNMTEGYHSYSGNEYNPNTCNSRYAVYNQTDDGYYEVGAQAMQNPYSEQFDYAPNNHQDVTNNTMNQSLGTDSSEFVDSICYSTNQPPIIVHSSGEADNYGNFDTEGDSISSLSVDREGSEVEIMYVASHTSLNNSTTGRGGRRVAGGIGVKSVTSIDGTLTRGSRMTVLYQDEQSNGLDDPGGMSGSKRVYSSFVAHPEAEPRILDSIHAELYGGGSILVSTAVTYNSGNAHRKPRPSNSYGPPYGTPSSVAGAAANPAMAVLPNPHRHPLHRSTHDPYASAYRAEDRHCMGISSILPFATPYFGSGGRVCTVSPFGVRIHTRGGMMMSEKRGLLSGMICAALMDNNDGVNNFVTVGGMSCPISEGSYTINSSSSKRPYHVHCIDIHRDLKIVSSHTLSRDTRGTGSRDAQRLCVSHMAVNRERNNVVLGCSDGTIRILDGGRRQAEVAKAMAHSGGVAQVAVYDNLICATGYTSPGISSVNSPLPYPFPAQHVLIYDVRYLGRGGIPHMFSATRGGPRFVSFLPSNFYPVLSDTSASDEGARLLVGSGQTFGGFEVITPFQNSDASSINSSGSNFFQPELNAGESMTTVSIDDGKLFIGSSCGRVLQYGMTNYHKTTHVSKSSVMAISGSNMQTPLSSVNAESFGSRKFVKKESLDVPPFVPSPSEVAIDPTILCSSTKETDARLFQGWDVFDSYTMTVDPIASDEMGTFHQRYSSGKMRSTSLGAMSRKPLILPPKRWLSQNLKEKMDEVMKVTRPISQSDAEFVKVFPTSTLDMTDLLEPDISDALKMPTEKLNGKPDESGPSDIVKTLPNPNKLVYSKTLFPACYDATSNPKRKTEEFQFGEMSEEEIFVQNEETGIPYRYRLMVRPPFYKVYNFDYSRHNETQLLVGWDYAPTFSNAFACPVFMLLYFIPEIRAAALRSQALNSKMAIQSGTGDRRERISITTELGLLFHLLESLSANGAAFPDAEINPCVPSNIVSSLLLLPEATNLALLDGVAGATEIAKRPEALYRFIMHYMDKEIEQSSDANSDPTSHSSLIDPIQGINFVSVIEYSTGKPKVSSSRALTVDLCYDHKLYNKAETSLNVRFGDILRFSLCKEVPLRAWCDESSSYESVIQRKIATSLPKLLSLSCCCAGKLGYKNGLQFWKQRDKRNWLPEYIEVEIALDRSVVVRELVSRDDENEEWVEFKQSHPLSSSIFDNVDDGFKYPTTKKYQLDAVCSFIRNNGSESIEGHHVIHVRAPKNLECQALRRQIINLEKFIAGREIESRATEGGGKDCHMTIASRVSSSTLQQRKLKLQQQLETALRGHSEDAKERCEWLLFNGFVVTKTTHDDVRSFTANFKEPSLVLFREIDDVNTIKCPTDVRDQAYVEIPTSVMNTTSISGSSDTKHSTSNLPGKGDLVAIDAEFVCVQAEESRITSAGSKEITSQPRNSLARLSIIDCRSNIVLVDDFVFQREQVSDYLTRFSGIRESDLDPNTSPHHLVTMQEAYLKVRLLMDRGCIFVGHGLREDFRIINISVPPSQIIDTSFIYHQPNQRYISLRYLTNYVLGRDMQQEIHDSIEDARAAYDLYTKALSLRERGKFDEYLTSLYSHGHRTQFKLRVRDEENDPPVN